MKHHGLFQPQFRHRLGGYRRQKKERARPTLSPQTSPALNWHGVTRSSWRAAKTEARRILIERAKCRSFITASQLTLRIAITKVKLSDTCLHALLNEISAEEEQQGRGLLSVLVVHKPNQMQLGEALYEPVQQFERPMPDLISFWVHEFNRVFDYWQNHLDENP